MQTVLPRLGSLAVIAALAISGTPAQAQHQSGGSHGGDFQGGDFHGGGSHGGVSHGGGSQGGGYRHDFHGRDFGHFSPAERGVWRGGRWEHGWHDGRFAWWWTAGGGWYSYPAPLYPYPTYVPPAIVVQQPPPVPSGLPPAQFWYFCDNPKGYYPYVAACSGPWREVPATPRQ